MKEHSRRLDESSAIRVGIGGWTFEPWRGVFFPADLRYTRELEHASRKLATIEINGTYYRTQTPETYNKWFRETPDGFVFAVKASRFATNKKVLAEAGESVAKFLGSGLTELGDKLGPILWQFALTKRFETTDFGAFLNLLPARQDGIRLRHAVEARHDSFCNPVFIDLARAHGVAIVYTDSKDFPSIADTTADFIYTRLQCTKEEIKTGYSEQELIHLVSIVSKWGSGQHTDLPQFGATPAEVKPRDVFVYMISGAKVRNPAAAMALQSRVNK